MFEKSKKRTISVAVTVASLMLTGGCADFEQRAQRLWSRSPGPALIDRVIQITGCGRVEATGSTPIPPKGNRLASTRLDAPRDDPRACGFDPDSALTSL